MSSLPSSPTWIEEVVDTSLAVFIAKPLEVPVPVIVIVSSGLVSDVIPPDTAVWILSLRACIPAATVWSAPISTPPVIAVPTLIFAPVILDIWARRPLADFVNNCPATSSTLTSITFSSVIETASPGVNSSCLPPTEVVKLSISALLVLIWFKSVSEIKPEPSTLSTLFVSWLVTVVICPSKAVSAASNSDFAVEIALSTCYLV